MTTCSTRRWRRRPADRAPGRPRFVWIGRMSPEKRLLPFLEAVVASGIDAEIEVIGSGGQLRAARRIIEKGRPRASVVYAGRMPYAETLRRIQAADAVVQTSIGFETQGMTVFEAASLGTPAVVSRPRHRRRARFRPVGCGRWLGGCARGNVAACCRRHRGRYRARTRPDSARALPSVVADRRDDRGLRARHVPDPFVGSGRISSVGATNMRPDGRMAPETPELSVAAVRRQGRRAQSVGVAR